MKDLAGKTAFVTGAASGIGLGVATSLAQAGVKVMLCDIEQAALDAAVARLKETNADVEGVKADVSLKAELQAAADRTLERYGKVHILHNNAGVGGAGGYGSWNDAGWDWTIGVNLMAVIWGVEIFGPLIERHGEGGHIVNTASIAGLISGSGNAYNVTKYGVVSLSEGLRVELAPRGIGVSVLCPGFTRADPGNVTSFPLPSADWYRDNLLSPDQVAEETIKGIMEDRLHIFPHRAGRQEVIDRHDLLLQAFDQAERTSPPLSAGRGVRP